MVIEVAVLYLVVGIGVFCAVALVGVVLVFGALAVFFCFFCFFGAMLYTFVAADVFDVLNVLGVFVVSGGFSLLNLQYLL